MAVTAYDSDWDTADGTEHQAFLQARQLLPEVSHVVFLGFPWATLMDSLNANTPKSLSLLSVLQSFKPLPPGKTHIITVCQHADLFKHQHLFSELGVNHVFWSQAEKGIDRFPDFENIRVYPFPVAPGKDVDRVADQSGKMLSDDVPDRFFALCPSGDKTVCRIWQAVHSGRIPVLFDNNLALPGNAELWREATVAYPEELKPVDALPDVLSAIADNPYRLKKKEHALRQLRLLYGPDGFIYDIQKLFLSLAQENSPSFDSKPLFSYGKLLNMAADIRQRQVLPKSVYNAFVLACSSRLLADPSGFERACRQHETLRRAYKNAMHSCDRRYASRMERNIRFRNIDPEERLR